MPRGYRPAQESDDKGTEREPFKGPWAVAADPAFSICAKCDGYGWNAGKGREWEDRARRVVCADCQGEGWIAEGLVTLLSMSRKAKRDREADDRRRRGEPPLPFRPPGAEIFFGKKARP